MRFDSLLNSLAAAHQQIADQSSLGNSTESVIEPAWVTPPAGSQPFDEQGAIALPVAGSGDAVILTLIVPPGWDGVIKRLSANLAAGGFVQGSGQIIFRILRNGQAVRGYDNVLTELGSVQQPRPTDGIQIYENDIVTLVVNNVSLGGGAFYAMGSLAGYFWPKD